MPRPSDMSVAVRMFLQLLWRLHSVPRAAASKFPAFRVLPGSMGALTGAVRRRGA